MKFIESLKKTEFTLTEGDKKVGKLTFALYDAYINDSKKVLIFTTYNKTIFEKRLEAIKNQKITQIDQILQKSRYLALKEEWPQYKAKFGIDFLLKDIHRAIEKEKPDFVIFHRFDLFFEPFEDNILKTFIEKIIDYKNDYNFKINFTATKSDINNVIVETIENFSDLNIEIKKEDEIRTIQIKNSIFPISSGVCQFLIINNNIKLIPHDNDPIQQSADNIEKHNDTFRILIISRNENIVKKLKYIFQKDIFEIDFADKISEIIKKVMTNPDIIIYNPFDKELDFSVCETIKSQQLKSKLIYVTNENYIRSDDKITAINHGCYDIFPLNFNIVEFISEIEKMIGINFYSFNIQNLKITHKITSKQMFCTVIKTLYNERIYFTSLIVKADKLYVERLRDHDFYYEENGKYYLILINTTKDYIQNVLAKLSDNNNYEIEKIAEAYEAENFIREICK